MKKIFSFLAAVLFAGSMMAAEVEVAKATFDGKNATYTTGWTTTGTGVSRTDCVIIGKDENITSPTIDISAYNSISITFKARRYGSLSGSKATISVAYGSVELGTIDVTASSVGNVPGSIDYTVPAGLAASAFVFTCTNATSVGSTHGAGIGEITITGNTGGESVAANFCLTEVGHLMEATPAQDSYVLLSIGSKGGKTIVRIDQDGEKNTAMFDYLQVTGLTQTGEDVAEGGVAAMAVEFDTPTPVNDSLTLEILWSTVNWPGRWMVQNLRVAVAECEYAVIPLVPITCAEVYNMAKNDEVLLNDVTVTFANGKNVWVKDATGSMLVYLPDNGSFAAGDVLSGVEGVVDIYNGVTEVKPSAAQVAAIDVTAGEAPAPEELTAVAASDVNKYIVIKNLAVEGEFVEGTASNITLTLADESTIVLRSNFKNAYAFDAAKTYNITAVVTIYQSNPQLYFISAEEYEEPVGPQLNIMAYGLSASEVADGKVTISYSLNAKATAVEIQLLDAEGEVAETFAAPKTELAKGAHSVELDLEGVDAASYHWAVKATAKASNAVEPIQVATVGTGSTMSRVVTVDNSFESPYYGNIYAVHGLGVGLYGFDASLEPLFGGNAVATNGWNPGSNSSPCAAKVSEDGLVYMCDWADTNPNVRIFDPATPTADAKSVFGGTGIGSGLMVNEAGDTIHGSMRYCYPKGSGENTVLYTVDEDYKPGAVTHVFKYNIGTAATPWTAKPSGEGFTHAMTGGKWAGTVDNIAFVPSKEEGGWWIAQHRYTDGAAVPSLMHIAGDTLNYFSTGEFANATVGYNNQATLAINNEQSLIVTATNNTKYNILVSEVTWTNHIPTVAVKYTFPSNLAGTCLGLALDEAGNIYAIAPNKPVTIWALPKEVNSCVTPAANASLIVIKSTETAIDNIYVLEVQKVIRNGQVLIIKDGKTYNMMGQIVE